MPKPQLIIRPLEASDREDYYAIFSNPEVTKYDDFDPITYDELDKVLNTAINSPATKEIEYGVILESVDQLIGVLTVHKKRKYWYLGYHFNPLFHRQGYATQALLLLMQDFTPEQKAISRLAIHQDNIASIKVAAKAGFVESRHQRHENNSEIIFIHISALHKINLATYTRANKEEKNNSSLQTN